MKYPLVTINILSFNRCKELQLTLNKVFEQDYKNIEVIVVDNASSDGTQQMVKKEFPTVNLVELTENIGIAGWNKGFEIAKGEYVLVLDDDSYPSKTTISNGVNLLNQQLSIGIIAFNIVNSNNDKIESLYFNSNELITFIGCGAMIKAEIFNSTYGFSEILFLYEHEVEFSMRAHNLGFKIEYLADSIIYHSENIINRKISKYNSIDYRREFFVIRNILVIIFLHFSLNKTLLRIVRIICGRLYFAFLDGYFTIAVKAITNFLFMLPKLFLSREILNDEVQKKYLYGGFAGGFFFGNNNFKRMIKQKLLPTKFKPHKS